MGILTKDEIINRIQKDQLIIDVHSDEDGGLPTVEPASYDLRVGTIIWKESENNKEIKRKDYNPELPLEKQDMVTIQPGQVMFVITKEQVKMPLDLCGTVYAKNEFSRSGILLFTTGHVDPGIQCPIVIRLVNLRAIPFTLTLGNPIYTIVFHTLQPFPGGTLDGHRNISMLDTIERTKKSAEAALGNSLYDLSLLSNFIKKDEFEQISSQHYYIKESEWGKAGWKWMKKNMLKIFSWIIAIILFLATVIGAIPTAIESWKDWKNAPKDSSKVKYKNENSLPTPTNSSSQYKDTINKK
jgi:deoxycytidine triphosphate deaminase